MILLAGILVVAFAITSVVVHRYREKLQQLGDEWSGKGRQALAAGRPADAVTAFQAAQRYAPEAIEYRYGLVNALLAGGRTEQARSYLLNMWEHQPGDGLVNLQLARIAAGKNDTTEAAQYYHNAIYGAWDDDGAEHRRAARIELTNFLLDHGYKRRADAEATTLAASAPPTPELTKTLCILFSRSEDYDAALSNCEAGLRATPDDGALLSQAALASFELGQYAATLRYLERERRLGQPDPNENRLRLAEAILNNNPFDAHVSYRVRVKRMMNALVETTRRLKSCPDPSASNIAVLLAQLQAAQSKASVRQLQRDPDLLANTAALVFAAQEEALKSCGEPAEIDEALLFIGRHHQEARP